mmetsp:Transcript_28788/g.94077  ORF Transcript_28788/g.94077 Transcript_28788/m.94077 type:complete len:239 (-) Transcript_28788:123-839(-)
MAFHNDRWSRGCGTGIGLSGHKNQYRLGVTIENWVEDSASATDYVAGKTHLYGEFGAKFQGATTTSESYTADGKMGMNLVELSDRQDLEVTQERIGLPKEHMFQHSLSGPTSSLYDATLSSLAFADPAAAKKKQVHCNLWAGSKFNDAYVPTRGSTTQEGAGALKAKQAQQMQAIDMYRTHSQDVAEQAVLMASIGGVKRERALPMSEGGQAPQIGRKAKGDCCKSFDAAHVKIGLRK